MFSNKQKAWIGFVSNIGLAVLGAIVSAGLAEGDTWAFVNQPYVVVGCLIGALGVVRAASADHPSDVD